MCRDGLGEGGDAVRLRKESEVERFPAEEGRVVGDHEERDLPGLPLEEAGLM